MVSCGKAGKRNVKIKLKQKEPMNRALGNLGLRSGWQV